MPKRIFYISPGTDLGGGEISLLTLITNLDRNRFEPIVCVYGPGRFLSQLQTLNCEHYVLQYTGLLSQTVFILKLAQLIRRSRASVVHVNTLDIRAGVAAQLACCKLIGHLRVIFPTTWVDRTFVNLAATTISVSNAARNHFCKEQRMPPEKFTTIYNAVDIPNLSTTADSIREELKLTETTPIFGVVGRIDPWKGMETFVEAAAILKHSFPDIHYIIIGSPGPSTEEQEYNRHLRNRVAVMEMDGVFHFLGFRSNALSLIKQLTALVVPSRILQTSGGIKTEGFGRVAAEGLAMHTPVIASNVGGLPEIIDAPHTGLLFDSENASSLAEAMKTILTHSEQTVKMIEAGYERFKAHFSVPCHLDQVQTLYDRFITS